MAAFTASNLTPSKPFSVPMPHPGDLTEPKLQRLLRPFLSNLDAEDRLRRSAACLPEALQHPTVLVALQNALVEDLSAEGDWKNLLPDLTCGDVTSSATLREETTLRGQIRTKAEGVVAGLPVVAALFQLVSPGLSLEMKAEDGERVDGGEVLAAVSGPGRALLTAERPALNLLGRCSGIATLTRRFVKAVEGTGTRILDTRKTAPGLRRLDKYAVRQGGGMNHRLGLFDMVLIKDNHIDAAGSITGAVERVREVRGKDFPIEVEVKTLDELDEALTLEPTRILLDNMTLDEMRRAARRSGGRVPLEASGNVVLGGVRTIAETGVDFISVGALTHSAPVFDVSLRID